MAQAQELTAHEPSPPENYSATEASKQAANPLANVWLMQIQQNTNWMGMPGNKGNRVQSNLQFQPLIWVKLTDDWNLITRWYRCSVRRHFSTKPDKISVRQRSGIQRLPLRYRLAAGW